MKSIFIILLSIVISSGILFNLLASRYPVERAEPVVPAGKSTEGAIRLIHQFRFRQFSPSAVVFPDTHTSVLILEPSDALKFLDNDHGAIKNDANAIIRFNSSDSRNGAAADGVSKLIILIAQNTSAIPVKEIQDGVKTPLPPLTLSLPSGAGKDGYLSRLDAQDVKNMSLTVDPVVINGNRYVIAIYTPPDGYGGEINKLFANSGRKTTISARAEGSSGIIQPSIYIHTPPVILVHGIWSSPGIWKSKDGKIGLKNYLVNNQNFKSEHVNAIRYKSDQSWYQGDYKSDGVVNLKAKVEEMLARYKKESIAATQVDIIGHSMGALMSRAYIQSPYNNDKKGYGVGYVHKLITLGTPHFGSPLMCHLWDRAKDWIIYNHVVPLKVRFGFNFKNMPIASAVKELRQGSKGLQFLEKTKVKAHAVIGKYLPAETKAAEWFNSQIKLITKNKFNDFNKIINEESDVLVGITSQKGGLDAKYMTPFQSTIHSLLGPAPSTTETNNPDIFIKVKDLLLSDKTDDFAAEFPKPTIIPCPNTSGFSPDQSEFTKKLQSSLANPDSPLGFIQIISPLLGTSYPGGSPDSITLQIDIHGKIVPGTAYFMLGDMGPIGLPEIPPFKITVGLPKHLPAGKMIVSALAMDSAGQIVGDRTNIFFGTPTGSIQELTVEPAALTFDSLYNHQALTVSADFINGVDTSSVDLTDPQSGTTYKLLVGNNVVKISDQGEITALKQGTEVLEVRYKDKLATVNITVISVCKVPKPAIIVAGNILVSSSSKNNQWFIDGFPLDGDTSGIYTATDPGAYSVQVTDGCSSQMSEIVRYKTGLFVAAKAFLQGPFSNGLMNDSLRKLHLLPTVQPYSSLGFKINNNKPSNESVTIGLLDSVGNKAITDWIWLELRSSSDPKVIVSTRCALIRRDGNIVDIDGISPVLFDDMPEGNYYLAIRHRNHLGVMTGAVINFSNSTTTVIDFTSPATITYGNNAQKNSNGMMMMWAGDLNSDGLIKYNGAANDKALILQKLGANNPTGLVSSYDVADINLDGKVKYNGASNDKTLILSNVGVASPTNIITEQLPK